MMHDVSGPGVIKVFDEWSRNGITLNRVWDPEKVWVSEDHFVPAADKISADNVQKLTNWTTKFGIKKHYKYGLGQYGICHTLSKLVELRPAPDELRRESPSVPTWGSSTATERYDAQIGAGVLSIL